MKVSYLLGATATAVFIAAAASASSAQPVPLPRDEVREMYSGNTWMWNPGGGYFAPDGSFHGWTRDDEYGLMYGSGRWSVEIGGQLCYSARWYYGDTSSAGTECFAHWVSNGAVLQRDERNLGDWYVFGRRRAPGDYSSPQLRGGDRVTAQMPDRGTRLQR